VPGLDPGTHELTGVPERGSVSGLTEIRRNVVVVTGFKRSTQT